jgi:glycosyltransferase involved in cell wall biosynthesis
LTDLHAISSYGPAAASTRVRLYDWFRFLGIEAKHHCYAGLNNNRPSSIASHPAKIARAEVSLRRLDLTDERVMISREASPFSRGNIEARILRGSALGVYDFDDALFHDQSPIRRLLGTQDKCRRAVAAADVVIAGNDYLGNWAESHGKDVRVIPSCVDPCDYEPKTQWSISGDAPLLVWLGSPATERYVAQIGPALLEVHRRTGASLTLISGPDDNPALAPLRHMLRRVPWSIETFASDLTSADVAIAPLDNSPYSRGKCAYKLLQYAASGLPVAGSPVGANDLALQRFHGLSPSTPGGWIDALCELLNESAGRRAERAARGLEAVEHHYSFGAWKDEWLKALGIRERDQKS